MFFKEFLVLKAGLMFVFLHSFVMCRIYFPTNVNTAQLFFSYHALGYGTAPPPPPREISTYTKQHNTEKKRAFMHAQSGI
jgi:hypothetical protein